MLSPESSHPSPLKVLVVEDEGLIALDIRKALASLGHQVTDIASTAEEAVRAALAKPPDLVLMDIHLRGDADGISAAAQIREKFDVPVVFVTAHSDRETIDRVKKVDAYGYIVKPFTPAGLNVTIEIAMQRKSAGDKLLESNQSLAALNERLTNLSYSLSHDLREPLRTVSVAAQLLARSQVSLDPDTREYIDWINDGCSRMDHLLSALLAYYRDGSGELQAPTRVAAAECLETALAHLQAALQQADADIQFHPLPDVVCHPVALVQIFQNLIANALKYRSDRQPEVYISAHRHQEFWTFAVTDNGLGFSRSKAEAIFDLIGGAHGKEYSGAGIGLALCRRLVEHYGGSIWAESSVGYGSTFFFTLPAELAGISVASTGKNFECQSF